MLLCRIKYFFAGLLWFSIMPSCSRDPEVNSFVANKLVLLIIDGPRYSETWGDSSHANIPELVRIAPEGTLFTSMRNSGVTQTMAGHTSILTGHNQSIDNSGFELPQYPSFLQGWIKKHRLPEKVWLITSKDKLEVLKDCQFAEFNGKYLASSDCGNDGLGTGYRDDSVTFAHAMEVLKTKKPDICVIQLKQPDAAGHTGVWLDYINGLRKSDQYMGELFDFLQTNSYYRNSTTFIVVNDHGRHLDPPLNAGFQQHGDQCEGCRNILLFASGPDIKRNFICNKVYDQRDLNASINALLHLHMPFSEGVLMEEMLVKPLTE